MRLVLMRGLLLGFAALILPACDLPPGMSRGMPRYSDPEIETFPDEGHEHVAVGTVVSYKTDPPTSGPHYPNPQPGGYYLVPIESGFLVHSLEHGAVVLYYNPATTSSAERKHLKALARAHPGVFGQVVAVPRDDPSYPVILTAWTHRLRLSTYDEDRIDGFLTLFLGQGPESAP